ncbi:MAG: HipA N-terminal domain-containing protein [Candidatus Paracaedibacteraceae bacterium]|nr:HipA N-terminal domain-containing protein [Candidatus Paracaedibacteraceae bacterium]
MRQLLIKYQGLPCGILQELEDNNHYQFSYLPEYHGASISLTLPVKNTPYEFDNFPPFFDGLLPEGIQLEALLRRCKIDQTDYMTQLAIVGEDLVGSVTAHELKSKK